MKFDIVQFGTGKAVILDGYEKDNNYGILMGFDAVDGVLKRSRGLGKWVVNVPRHKFPRNASLNAIKQLMTEITKAVEIPFKD